jgi:hypothetical protein
LQNACSLETVPRMSPVTILIDDPVEADGPPETVESPR